MTDIFNLKGKTALVTGSSRGIGKAMAMELARHGADIILHCVKPCDTMNQTIAEISAFGGKVTCVYADLFDRAAVDGIYQTVKDSFVLPDILVLNASVQIRRNWLEISPEDFDTQVNVNFYASLRLMQSFAPHMQEQGWGRIVTIGSVQQTKPHEAMLVYSATKDAQVNMVKSLAKQLAPFGITVNNLAPGTVYTDRNKEVLADDAYMEKVVNSIPVRFIAKPEDCAGTALLLCSDAGRFITGEDIYVDGGAHL